jgi:hypothetical protein
VFLEKSSISMFFGFFYPTIFYLPNHKQVFLEKYSICPIYIGCFWNLWFLKSLPNLYPVFLEYLTRCFWNLYPIYIECFWNLLPNLYWVFLESLPNLYRVINKCFWKKYSIYPIYIGCFWNLYPIYIGCFWNL